MKLNTQFSHPKLLLIKIPLLTLIIMFIQSCENTKQVNLIQSTEILNLDSVGISGLEIDTVASSNSSGTLGGDKNFSKFLKSAYSVINLEPLPDESVLEFEKWKDGMGNEALFLELFMGAMVENMTEEQIAFWPTDTESLITALYHYFYYRSPTGIERVSIRKFIEAESPNVKTLLYSFLTSAEFRKL